MSCKEVTSEKYQTRKSPAFHARDCAGQTKKGKDGDYLSKADSKGIYKWVKISGATRKVPKGKHYDIHDNGSNPYRVFVDGSKVSIYKDTNTDFDKEPTYTKLIKELTVKEVFVPKHGGAFGLGNSILLHVSGNKYMHIGVEIYEFTMEDEVDTYYSLIGNSDVPYPVLLGTKYVYFMLDHAYLPRELFKMPMKAADWEDAYQYFYGFNDFETGKPFNCHTKPKKQREICKKEQDHKIKEINKEYVKKMKGFKISYSRR
jgi:hypothetical protein